MNIDLIVLFTFCAVFGILAHRKRLKDVSEGRIQGVPQSKGLFDFMFYNFRE